MGNVSNWLQTGYESVPNLTLKHLVLMSTTQHTREKYIHTQVILFSIIMVLVEPYFAMRLLYFL